MRAYWIGRENRYRVTFRRYAAVYKQVIPDNADIIAVSEDNGKLCAFAVLEINRSFADIVLLLVFEGERRKGIGSFLLDEVTKFMNDAKVGILRCFIPFYEGYHELFTSKGFEVLPGKKEYAVPFGAFRYSEMYVKQIEGKDPGSARSIGRCSLSDKNTVKKYLDENGISGTAGYDKEVSIVSISEGGISRVEAALLCEKKTEGVMIHVLYSRENDMKHLFYCFRRLDSIISGKGDEAYTLKFFFATEDSDNLKLARYFSGDPALVEEIVREETAILKIV